MEEVPAEEEDALPSDGRDFLRPRDRRLVTGRARAIQNYLGHRNIQHTALYTQLAADRFNDFWKD
jgi:site-specific recombinase XerC